MGQKVNPIGLRIGINKTWNSRWFADKDYSKFLHEDLQIRSFLKKQFYHAGIADVVIERSPEKAKVIIYTAKPGIIIGRKGAELENLKKMVQKFTKSEIFVQVEEVRRPELSAVLVAENVALQLERRVAFRRAMKKAVTAAMRMGAKGIKISCAGRLAGAEIARTEWYREGRVPLQTLRADIDYGTAIAKTKYGVIGIKVAIFKGEVGQYADFKRL
ncbi:MAG: 30S ribosomal protein S3 [Proteobacteria bacterium]|nr:30S ribosomal protein S3 [Pseudomonadota bacterium]